MSLDLSVRELLKTCRNFTGPPADFWQHYARLLGTLSSSEKLCILVKNEAGKWNALAAHPPAGQRFQIPVALGDNAFQAWQDEAVEAGFAIRDGEPVRQGTGLLLAVESGSATPGMVLFHDPVFTPEAFQDEADLLLSVADVPASYLKNRQLQQAMEDVRHCLQTLDTLSIINSQNRFYAMAMALCNEVKDRFRCSRVSLGYFVEPYVRVQAISNMDRFEPKMDIVQLLEAVMEEAVDQDEDLQFPPPENDTRGAVTREHQQYSKAEGGAHLLTMPLRSGEDPFGAICFERDEQPFSEHDQRAFRVLCNQCARRIKDLKEQDRWFGARWARRLRDGFGGFLGYTHTWRKVFAILGAALLLSLVFIRVEYRVEAPCILRSTQLLHLPAPFDGFIETVEVKVGDIVEEGQLLLSLDTSELLVERANRLAEIQRFSSQIENAQAEKRLADLRIATAQRDQSLAALELIDFQLDRAEIRAPFQGVIVEGDLTERVGAPVTKGDNLFRLSRLEDLFLEIKVDERDLADIQESLTGEFALASRPDQRFAFDIERIEPVAQPEAQGNVFQVRGLIDSESEAWWRPGMSGVAKINTEKRSLLWIFTHRLVDFLRMQLWW